MKATLQVLAVVLLILPMLPVGAAQDLPGVHNAERPEIPNVPQPSSRPLGDTNVIPIDNLQDDVVNAGADLFRQSQPIVDQARDAINASEQAAPAGLITLFKDGFEGDRTGGYGSWLTQPSTGPAAEAWGVRIGDDGKLLTTGTLHQGYYPGSTTSLLVTPELDLRTGTLPDAGVPPQVASQFPAAAALLAMVGATMPPGAVPCAGVPFVGAAMPIACQGYETARGAVIDAGNGGFEAPSGIAASAVYRMLLNDTALLLYGSCFVCLNAGGVPNPLFLATSEVSHLAEPRDSAFTFAFERRFNLAGDARLDEGRPGRDAVQLLVFTQPPTLADVQTCVSNEDYARGNTQIALSMAAGAPPPDASTCTKVHPLAAEGRPARPFPNAKAPSGFDNAYTGYANWRTDYVDLTSWAGQSVWVGFLFASGAIGGDADFRNADLFDTEASFYGFELDNVTLRVPAQQLSVRVRPFTEPSTIPDGRPHVTLPIGSEIPVSIDIANMGTNPVEVEVHLRLTDRDDATGTPLLEDILGSASIAPAGVHRAHTKLEEVLTAQRANYTLTVETRLLHTTAQTPEADPTDNVVTLALDILDVTQLRVGTLERRAASIASDGTETFRLSITNTGNLPTYANATAEVVSAATGAVTAALPFEGAGATLKGPPLAVGGTRVLEWTMSGAAKPLIPGQYHLFVRLNDEAGFDASRDFLPSGRPFQSTWTDTPPTVDGEIEGLWGTTPHPVEFRDSYYTPATTGMNELADPRLTLGSIRVLNDAESLYVAFKIPRAPATLALLLDDDADGILTAGKDNGYMAGTDLTYRDADVVGAADIRLVGGDLPSFESVRDGADLGLPLSDGERLTRIHAIAAPASDPNPFPDRVYIDLDGSGTVSRGDYDFTEEQFVAAVHPDLGKAFHVTNGPAYFCGDVHQQIVNDPLGHAYTVQGGIRGRAGVDANGTVTREVNANSCNALGAPSFSPIQPSVRFHDANGNRVFDAGDTLYLQPWRLPWSPADGLGGEAGIKGTMTNATYEFKIPLQDAGPGGLVGLLGLLDVPSQQIPVPPLRFPSAPVVDGEGFTPRNGDLADEVASWFKVALAGPPEPQVAPGIRLLSLGFGVERAPPPMFQEDLQDCAGLAGWSQTGIMPPSTGPHTGPNRVPEGPMGRSAEKWNCAPYGPDGRLRLYHGLEPNAMCDGQPCPTWSGVAAHAPATSGRNPNDLISPPFRVAPVADPYLILRHQYSSNVVINDEAVKIDGHSVEANGIQIHTVARVFVQAWDEAAQAWEEPILVRPADGYSTEESEGILHEDASQRLLRSDGGLCKQDQEVHVIPPCGWWAPTGYQGHYQPVGEDFPAGQGFRGSPWTVDRLPLFGSEHGFGQDKTLVLADRTIRLIFETYPSPGVADDYPDFPQDIGWRIDGLAVTEGPHFAKDVAVTGLAVVAPFYDPAELGLGPGTTIQVNVTVRNEGLLAASGVHVCVAALDVANPGPAASPCDGGAEKVVDELAPGEVRSVLIPFEVPDVEGLVLSFLAAAHVETGDDFPANNELRDLQVLRVHAVPDAAVVVDASPRDGSPATARTLLLRVVNRGNVPLTGFEVIRTVVRSDGADAGAPILNPKTWMVNDILPVGRELDLQSFAEGLISPGVGATDLVLPAPGRTGTFTFFGQVRMPGDTSPRNDVDTATIRALDILYQNTFDGATLGVTLPEGSVWSIQPGGYTGQRLLAGDPQSGEMPIGTDEVLQLPALDLTSAKDAILTFRHRYDLETGFDAARVEVSSDGGTTWRMLRPVPHLGMPDGYPAIPLTGTNALLGGAGEASAVAFTGRSDDLPGAANGWALSEFNLASDPTLSRRSAIDAFRLEDLSAFPNPVPSPASTGELQFRASDWTLDEANAEARQRYWWIENLTYSSPTPHSGQQMWWSGSSGPGANAPVRNVLEHRFAVPEAPALPGQQVLLTWWEWRAGGADGGTGGIRSVVLADHPRDPFLLASDEDGWRQLALDLTDLQGKDVLVSFRYDSVATPTYTDPKTANNLGWFLDDLQLVSSQYDAARGIRLPAVALRPVEDLDGLDPRSIAADGTLGSAWRTAIVPGNPSPSATRWSLVPLGAAAQDGGWHIAPTFVPGRGEVPAWRFAADNAQGYPHQAESRLVTPVMDLGRSGGGLRLEFDHRYWFESMEKCPFDEVRQSTAEARRGQGCFRSAVDGGAVEYQVLDPATGLFGPWQALGVRPDAFPERLLFEAETDVCGGDATTFQNNDNDPSAAFGGPCSDPDRSVDRLSNLGGSRLLLETTGYTAIEERGERSRYVPPNCGDTNPQPTYFPVGHGSQWVASPGRVRFTIEGCADSQGSTWPNDFLQPWRPYPVSYVFSGHSPGPGGWQTVSWDVGHLAGEQVRFAFHAFSNPGYVRQPGEPKVDERGWSLANVAVVGDTFQGRPVLLRLHLATDGSLGSGEWSLDDITVSGATYRRNVAVIPDGPDRIEALPGEKVTFTGRLANLASSAPENVRSGLGLVMWAVREDNKAPFTGWTLKAPATFDALPLPGGLPPGAAGFKVPLLTGGSSLPLAVDVTLPSNEASIRLHFMVVENLGTTQDIGGTFVHTPDYQPFVGEVPGNTEWSWLARATRRVDVELRSPVADRAGPILADPALAAPGQAVTLSAALVNNGTTEPSITARWQVVEVLRKASADQPGITEATRPAGAPSSQALGIVRRGESRATQSTFTPSQDGLYRATLTLQSPDGQLAAASTEFLVASPGTSPSYYEVVFSQAGEEALKWTDHSTEPDPGTGDGTPAGLRFRMSGDRYIWGVESAQYAVGTTYCAEATCNFPSAKGNDNSAPPIGDVTGLNGIAWGPPVDLHKVPQGRAFLTLRHDINLEAGDGARLEAIPLLHGTETPAFKCANGDAMPFRLVPTPSTAYGAVVESRAGAQFAPFRPDPQQPAIPGEAIPNRHNALSPEIGQRQVAFGGTLPDQVTRFALDQLAVSTCRDANGLFQERHLVNYDIRPVLHVATLPGYTSTQGGDHIRKGAEGWQISGMSISSAALDLQPSRHAYTVQGGAPKDFLLTLRNLGTVEDRVHLALDAQNSTLPDPMWVSLPTEPIVLAPGQSRVIVLTIAAPAGSDLRPGIYNAPIVAHSQADPNVVAILQATLDVGRLVLPDLSVSLTTDAGAEPEFSTGTVQPIHATVFNIGQVPSRPTQAILEAIDATTQTVVELGRKDVPALCPKGQPGCSLADAQRTLSLDWSVPQEAGDYTLRVRVDPDARLLEASKANNVATLTVKAVPLRMADLAVESIRVEGLAPDGTAQDGDLLTFVVNITNRGVVAAGTFRVRLLLNDSIAITTEVPGLGPGRSVEVPFAAAVPRGNVGVRATILASPGTDSDTSNDERRSNLLVKGHDLVLQASPGLRVAPGQAVDLQLNITNRGNTVERVLLRLDDAASGWGLRAEPNPVTIAPGRNASVTLSLRAPPDAPAGANTIRLMAVPSDNPAAGTRLELLVDVESRPGAPDLFVAPMAVPPGTVDLPVRLQSRSNLAQDLAVSLANPAWATDTVLVALAPGANETVHLTLTVPANASVGSHALVLRVATRDGVELLRKPVNLVIEPGPAMAGAWSGAARQATDDTGTSLFTFSLRVRNSGNVPVVPHVTVRDLAPGLDAPEIQAGGVLAPGEDRMIPVTLTLAADEPTVLLGRVDLWARPNDGTSPDSLSQTLEVPSLGAAPNLRVTRADPAPRTGIVEGDAIRVALVVVNDGEVEAPPSVLYALANGLLVQPVDVPAIPAGGSAALNVTMTFTRQGAFTLSFVADGASAIEERRDDDNGLAFDLVVGERDVGSILRGVPGLEPMLLGAALLALALAARRRRTA